MSLRTISIVAILLGVGTSGHHVAQQQRIDPDQAYVLGQVVKPMAIDLREPLTLAQAIARVGGLNKPGRYEKVNIIRLLAVGNSMTCTSMREIRHGRTGDFLLQANDIVEVTNGKCERPMCWTRNREPGLPIRIIK